MGKKVKYILAKRKIMERKVTMNSVKRKVKSITINKLSQTQHCRNEIYSALKILLSKNYKKYDLETSINENDIKYMTDENFQSSLFKINEKSKKQKNNGVYYTSDDVARYIICNSLLMKVETDLNQTHNDENCIEFLRNLNYSKNGAYDGLLQYAKKQVPTLRQDSFKDTKTGYLDYNIVADYPIENGKYYFIYSILDNENDTYIDVEDVGIYNGVSSEGVSRLDNFEYTGIVEGGEEEEIDTNKSDNVPDRNNDETTANRILPKAGKTSMPIALLCVTIIITVILYIKNRKYKDIK